MSENNLYSISIQCRLGTCTYIIVVLTFGTRTKFSRKHRENFPGAMKIKSKNASAIRPTAISIPNRLQRAPAHAHYTMSAFETFYLNGRHIHGPRRR